MVCCGITSDFIYQWLKSAENENSEEGNQLIYELLFQEGDLKEAEAREDQEEAKALIEE